MGDPRSPGSWAEPLKPQCGAASPRDRPGLWAWASRSCSADGPQFLLQKAGRRVLAPGALPRGVWWPAGGVSSSLGSSGGNGGDPHLSPSPHPGARSLWAGVLCWGHLFRCGDRGSRTWAGASCGPHGSCRAAGSGPAWWLRWRPPPPGGCPQGHELEAWLAHSGTLCPWPLPPGDGGRPR